MDDGDISDGVVAEVFNVSAAADSLISFWSHYTRLDGSPSETMRGTSSPPFPTPEISVKSVSRAGAEMADADYDIMGQIGEGGMGTVFEARQSNLSRIVALKMIRPDLMHDPAARSSFYYEAVITAGLEHPGIIPILDFGVTREGRALYAMKKVSGSPWSRVLSSMSLDENLAVLDKVADTIAYAHAKGVIHRDIKPGNILLGEFNTILLGDWGLALQENERSDFSHAQPGGTPQYMAPEMAKMEHARLGYHSDIYLLGAVLYELVTGKPPHPGSSPTECIESAAQNLLTGDKHGDEGLLAVALKAMAADPAMRFSTVDTFRKAVRGWSAKRRSEELCHEAQRTLKKAIARKDYDGFTTAAAQFSQALSEYPQNADARTGQMRTGMAYARVALANGEYDLASSAIAPFITEDDKAALLSDRIAKEKRRAERRRKHNVAIAVLAVALLLTGIAAAVVAYYANKPKLDSIAQTIEAYDAQEQHSNEMGLYRGIRVSLGELENELYTLSMSRLLNRQELEDMVELIKRRRSEFLFPDLDNIERWRQACHGVYEDMLEFQQLRNDLVARGVFKQQSGGTIQEIPVDDTVKNWIRCWNISTPMASCRRTMIQPLCSNASSRVNNGWSILVSGTHLAIWVIPCFRSTRVLLPKRSEKRYPRY